jgi:hypothetical protein
MTKSSIAPVSALAVLAAATLSLSGSAEAGPPPKPVPQVYDLLINVKPAGAGLNEPSLNARELLPRFEQAFRAAGVELGASETQRLVFDGFYLSYPNLQNLTVLTGALQMSRLVKIDGKPQWVITCVDGVFNWRAGPEGNYANEMHRGVESYVSGFMARCMKKA